MIKASKLRRGLLSKNLIIRICRNLRNPGRQQIVAAFMAGMVVTAALVYFGAGAGRLSAGENRENIVPEQNNMPGFLVPVNYQEIGPDENIIYELVYAFSERALNFG